MKRINFEVEKCQLVKGWQFNGILNEIYKKDLAKMGNAFSWLAEKRKDEFSLLLVNSFDGFSLPTIFITLFTDPLEFNRMHETSFRPSVLRITIYSFPIPADDAVEVLKERLCNSGDFKDIKKGQFRLRVMQSEVPEIFQNKIIPFVHCNLSYHMQAGGAGIHEDGWVNFEVDC